MKRKVGKLYNKPIVEGDINLVTSNEIHKDNLITTSSKKDNIEYFLYSELDDSSRLFNLCTVFKGRLDNDITIADFTPLSAQSITGVFKIIAFGVDLSDKVIQTSNGETLEISFMEILTGMGITESRIKSLPRISEKEFYTI